MPRHPAVSVALLAVLVASGIGGCGAAGAPRTTAIRSRAAVPALASRPATRGEIVVRGESSPESFGPYTFAGRYLVRFEQYAPENRSLDFSTQTPLTVALERRSGDPSGATALFGGARGTGQRELDIHGRYIVDVSFGDFPFVIRFTPRA